MLTKSFSLFALTLFISQVRGHGMVQSIKGANGVTTNGFGVKKTSDTSQASVSVIRGNTGCGNIQGKNVDTTTEIENAIKSGKIPTTNADGTLDMDWFQQNAGGDGGGPGTAAIDTGATGTAFKTLDITKNFGDKGSNSVNPMQIKVAPGTTCTGGSTKNVCLAKVVNSAGPFGSCFAFTTPDSKASAAPPASAPVAAPVAAPAPATADPAKPDPATAQPATDPNANAGAANENGQANKTGKKGGKKGGKKNGKKGGKKNKQAAQPATQQRRHARDFVADA